MTNRSQIFQAFAFAIVLLYPGTLPSVNCPTDDLVELYYMPFGFQTYVPVTREDIDRRAVYRFTIRRSSETAVRIIGLIESGRRTDDFDDGVVRLKVVTSGRSYYIDSRGNAETPSGKRLLDVHYLERLLDGLIRKYGSGIVP